MEKQKLQNNSQKLMELMREYWSINDIPSEKLKLIGYIRNELWQILSEKVVEEKEIEKEKSIEE